MGPSRMDPQTYRRLDYAAVPFTRRLCGRNPIDRTSHCGCRHQHGRFHWDRAGFVHGARPNAYYNPSLNQDKDIDVVASAPRLVGVTLADGTMVTDRAAADAIMDTLKAANKTKVTIKNASFVQYTVTPTAEVGEVKLCTNFTEFKSAFGDFSTDAGQRLLAHAVYGFFHDGGTRCYVAHAAQEAEIPDILSKFGAVERIALVAVPGITTASVRSAVVAHCAIDTQDRFAILDSDLDLPKDDLTLFDPFRNTERTSCPTIQTMPRFTSRGFRSSIPPPSCKTLRATACCLCRQAATLPSTHVPTPRGVHEAPAGMRRSWELSECVIQSQGTARRAQPTGCELHSRLERQYSCVGCSHGRRQRQRRVALHQCAPHVPLLAQSQ